MGFERNFKNIGESHNKLNNIKRLEPPTFSLRAFWAVFILQDCIGSVGVSDDFSESPNGPNR